VTIFIYWNTLTTYEYVYTPTYIENNCTFCVVIAVHNLPVMYVMPIVFLHVMPSFPACNAFLFEECYLTPKVNGCVHCLRCIKACFPKDFLKPYCILCCRYGNSLRLSSKTWFWQEHVVSFATAPAITAISAAPMLVF
jgi:hypothetical protein